MPLAASGLDICNGYPAQAKARTKAQDGSAPPAREAGSEMPWQGQGCTCPPHLPADDLRSFARSTLRRLHLLAAEEARAASARLAVQCSALGRAIFDPAIAPTQFANMPMSELSKQHAQVAFRAGSRRGPVAGSERTAGAASCVKGSEASCASRRSQAFSKPDCVARSFAVRPRPNFDLVDGETAVVQTAIECRVGRR